MGTGNFNRVCVAARRRRDLQSLHSENMDIAVPQEAEVVRRSAGPRAAMALVLVGVAVMAALGLVWSVTRRQLVQSAPAKTELEEVVV